ncbi:hypothetical protein AC579_6441 [Pseudocercospora musae]|uniref:Uncharacterized protein n=1 Tax=Pseudocercospora musae TaxID=113226 RepID=A0A139I210_9PEZI|nr:hypothetical protein AC579_6441 [Pseudocercospora musae]
MAGRIGGPVDMFSSGGLRTILATMIPEESQIVFRSSFEAAPVIPRIDTSVAGLTYHLPWNVEPEKPMVGGYDY